MADDGALTWIDESAARLQRAGYTEVPTDLASRTPTVLRALRRSEFRISWILTRMHVFVLLWEAPSVSAAALRALTDDAVEWARKTKGGWPNGLQNAIAVLPVAVTRGAPGDVVAEARRLPQKRWAAIAQPVVVDLDTGNAHTYSGRIVWGLVYQDFLGEQQSTVIGDLAGDTMRLPPRSARLRSALMLTYFTLWLVILIALFIAILILT